VLALTTVKPVERWKRMSGRSHTHVRGDSLCHYTRCTQTTLAEHIHPRIVRQGDGEGERFGNLKLLQMNFQWLQLRLVHGLRESQGLSIHAASICLGSKRRVMAM
jgi:hypothetical protein